MRAVGDHREVSDRRGQPPRPERVIPFRVWRSIAFTRVSNTKGEGTMNKLLSVIVAAMFAVGSASAFAASHAGAQMKDEKKTEKKAKSEKKAAPKGEKKAAPKGDTKKAEKKKAAPKKDEMKK